MKVTFALIFLAGLSSCTTPRPPTSVPLHSALPEKFSLVYSAPYGGFCKELTFENGYLARRIYKLKEHGDKLKNRLVRTEYFVPTQKQWLDFWKEADRIKIWSWKKQYLPSDINVTVYDGYGWSLKIKYRGHQVETSGENAGPRPGNPRITITEHWSDQLDDAVSLLVQEPELQRLDREQ